MKKINRVRILIAEDHAIVRQGLVALLNRKKGFKVVAEASDGVAAVALFNRYRPDVVLLDLRMPRMDGIEAICRILKEHPEAKIIVLTTYDEDEDIYRALQSGAKAYLLKDISREELFDNILAIHQGRSLYPSRMTMKMAKNANQPVLTKRELEVLPLLVSGKTNKEIGIALGVTEGTIKLHTTHILHKLGAETRTEASHIALKKRLVPLGLK